MPIIYKLPVYKEMWSELNNYNIKFKDTAKHCCQTIIINIAGTIGN